MNRFLPFVIVLACGLFVSCSSPVTTSDASSIENEIRGILKKQVNDWNQGNIEHYMSGYDRSDSLRFASGGEVRYGWQALLTRYKNSYPDRAAMGHLTFRELDVTVLADDACLVFGKWQLDRENDVPYGYFTLLFRNNDLGWKIVHDHTSSAE